MQTGEQDSHGLDAQDLRVIREAPQSHCGRDAAARLLQRHQRQVYLWCFRYVRDHDRALDLAQDALLSAYEKLPVYEHRARFTSWLFIIVRNRCLSELRRPSWRETGEVDPDELDAGVPEQIEDMARRDLWSTLARHLDRQELDALHLRYVEGFPVDSITEVLKIDQSSGARGVLQRARRKLRAAFDGGSAMSEGLGHGA